MTRPPLRPTLNVYHGQSLVGKLWLDEQRRFLFQYDTAWLASPERVPLSQRLPLQPEAFAPDVARPFFSNLLPESHVRKLLTDRLHISEKNDFGLLEAIGGDCAGAFSVLGVGQKPPSKDGIRQVSDAKLKGWLQSAPRREFIGTMERFRLSLAGAQDKLPVVVDKKGDLFLPEGDRASTHILKPSIERLEDSTGNEFFCMSLAAKAGLPVASVLERQEPERYLLVQRYDRKIEDSGSAVRLHQEDFCQALGVLPDSQYEVEGGPHLSDCFRLLAEVSHQPLEDRRNLLRWVIFNVLIGNADAHAKNLSLLYAPGRAELAPFYDLLSTAVYPRLAERIAMKIGGENRPRFIMGRHWRRMAEAISVKPALLVTYAKDLWEALPKLAKALQGELGDRPLFGKLVHIIEENVQRLQSRIQE